MGSDLNNKVVKSFFTAQMQADDIALRAKLRPGKGRSVIFADKLFPPETKNLISYANKRILLLL